MWRFHGDHKQGTWTALNTETLSLPKQNVKRNDSRASVVCLTGILSGFFGFVCLCSYLLSRLKKSQLGTYRPCFRTVLVFPFTQTCLKHFLHNDSWCDIIQNNVLFCLTAVQLEVSPPLRRLEQWRARTTWNREQNINQRGATVAEHSSVLQETDAANANNAQRWHITHSHPSWFHQLRDSDSRAVLLHLRFHMLARMHALG